jgi:hypothetical protein
MYGLCRKYDENSRALPPPRPLLYMPRRATSSTPSTAQQPSAPPPPAIPSRHLPPPPTDFSSSVTQSQDRAHARCRQGQPPRLGAPCLCDDPPHLCHRGGPTIQARGDPRGHPQALLSWRSSLRQLPRLDTLLRRDGICGEGGARARERGAAALRTPYLGHLVVVPENGFVVWVTGWRGIEQLQCLFVTHIGESNEAKIAHTTNIVIISIMLN